MIDQSEDHSTFELCNRIELINGWNLSLIVMMTVVLILSPIYNEYPGLVGGLLFFQCSIVIYQKWIVPYLLKKYAYRSLAVKRFVFPNINFAVIVWGFFTLFTLFLPVGIIPGLLVIIMTLFILCGALILASPVCNQLNKYAVIMIAPLGIWGFFSQIKEGWLITGLSIMQIVLILRGKKSYSSNGLRGVCTKNKTSELVKINKELESEILYRKNMEKALRSSEERYRTLFQNNPIETIIVDHSGRITGYNKAKARSLGRVPEVGEIMYKDYGSRHENNMFDELMDCIQTGEQKEFPVQKYNERFLHIRLSPYSGGAIITSLDITKVKKAEEKIQTLTREILMIQEKERKRIARDLHDSVAQDLSSLRISCETFFDDNQESSFKVRHKIKDISKVLQGTIHAIRDIAYELRPPSLDELGLTITLFRYCEEFKDKWGINVDFFSAGFEQIRIDSDTEINMYRLVQEALNNIRKHSHATKASVRLVASYPHVILRIEDNGIGFDASLQENMEMKNKHMGLRSMEERVSLLGGKMILKTKQGEGTRIFVEVPALKIKERTIETSSAIAANE